MKTEHPTVMIDGTEIRLWGEQQENLPPPVHTLVLPIVCDDEETAFLESLRNTPIPVTITVDKGIPTDYWMLKLFIKQESCVFQCNQFSIGTPSKITKRIVTAEFVEYVFEAEK